MAVDDALRYQLHQRLEGALGAEAASTLMAYLPPVGWADIATKRDLDHLEGRVTAEVGRLDQRIERLDAKIDGVEDRLGLRLEATKHEVLAAFRGELNAAITAQTRSMIFAMAGLLFTATTTAFAAARFA